MVAAKQQQAIVRTKDSFIKTYLRDPNIHGVAVGYRRRGGEITKEISIRFYVEKKRPSRKLLGDLIPPRLPLIQPNYEPNEQQHVTTDVQEARRITFASDPGSGDAVSVHGLTGTAGLVFRNKIDDTTYLLTCRHVLDPDFNGASGNIVVRSDPPVSGQLPRFLPLRRNTDSINTNSLNLDAAVCALPTEAPDAPVTHDGVKVARLEEPALGRTYEMYSRMLQQNVEGRNPDIKGTYRINDIGSDHSWSYLTNIILISLPAERGDSGSLVYRRQGASGIAAVGMLVGVHDDLAIVQNIRSTLTGFRSYEHLNLRLGIPGDI